MKALKHPTVQALLIGLVVIILGGVAKVYYDQASIPEQTRRNTALGEVLDGVPDALEKHLDALPEDKRALPPAAGWTPAKMSCAEPVQIAPEEAADPTWAALGLDFSKPTTFQFRWRVDKDAFTLLARTDSDCDGLYQVHKLTGERGMLGLTTENVKVENPGE